jgi:hypothetical protein
MYDSVAIKKKRAGYYAIFSGVGIGCDLMEARRGNTFTYISMAG